jgi:hypothetical protein
VLTTPPGFQLGRLRSYWTAPGGFLFSVDLVSEDEAGRVAPDLRKYSSHHAVQRVLKCKRVLLAGGDQCSSSVCY